MQSVGHGELLKAPSPGLERYSAVVGWKSLAAVAGLAMLVWGCGAVTSSDGALHPDPSNRVCESGFPDWVSQGESVERFIASSGLVRTYRVLVPDVPTTQPLPVVLSFHGLGDTAAKHDVMSGFGPVAAEHGFVVVTPDAYGPARAWRIPDAPALFPSVVGDVQFVRELIQELSTELCLDTDRVFATGFSNGAYFASLLACAEPDLIAGFAPVAGIYYPENGCSQPVSMQAWHDVNDEDVPLTGGNILGLFDYRGVFEYLALWEGHGEQCQRLERDENGVRFTDLTCTNGVVMQLVLLNDIGHAWPRGHFLERPAAESIWRFFESLPETD